MSEHITHTPQIKRLERSSSSRVLAGVSGGLGRYFDLNPAVFRLGFVVLTLLGGAGILVYVAALLVMPDEGREQSIAAQALAERSDRPWPIVGLGLVGVAMLVLVSRGDLWPSAGAGWALILIGGLVILWTSRSHKRGRRIAVVVTALLTLLAAAAAVAAVTVFAWFDVSLSDGIGERHYQPATAASVQRSYETGIGDLRIDLSKIDPATSARIDAHVGIGELKVIVPQEAKVVVDAHAKVGELFVLGGHDDGRDATVGVGSGGTLEIVARVGAGRIDVVRADG
jgi:phage shock protein PspC (stress-responsive transcriptional regulator)/predicted membrane protein